MVLYRFLERRLHSEHPLVDRRGIVAIERDHLSSSLATADHFERIGLDTFDRGVRDRGRGFATEPEFGACPVRLHHRGVGTAGIDGEDVDPFTLQFAAEGFTKAGEARFGGRVGGVERCAN